MEYLLTLKEEILVQIVKIVLRRLLWVAEIDSKTLYNLVVSVVTSILLHLPVTIIVASVNLLISQTKTIFNHTRAQQVE